MRVVELIRQAEREGWTAVLRPGGHWMLTHPDASEPVWFAATPSDARWARNALAQMRRVLPAEPKPTRAVEPRPKRRPRPRHKPAPLRAYPEGPILMNKLPEPERRQVPLEPPYRRLAGGPAGFRSSLDRW